MPRKSRLRRLFLLMIATASRVPRTAFSILDENPSHVTKTINRLEEEDLIKTTKSSPKLILLNTNELDAWKNIDPRFFEYISVFETEGARLGWNEGKVKRNANTASVISVALLAGFCVGPDNKQIEKIISEKESKYSTTSFKRFYTHREMTPNNSIRTRTNSSRENGVIYSRSLCSVCYCTGKEQIQLSLTVEKDSILLARTTAQRIFQNDINQHTDFDPIWFSSNDAAAIHALHHPGKKHKGTATVAEAARNKKALGLPFRYISVSRDGALMLEYISTFNKQEILSHWFSEEERISVPRDIICDAVIQTTEGKSLICFEFLSCNITKLNFAREQYVGRYGDIGIVCSEYQYQFVLDFFDNDKFLRIRPISADDIINLIDGIKEVIT